jgi:hypothetical protein
MKTLESVITLLKQTDKAEEQFRADLNELLLKWSGTHDNGVFWAACIEAEGDDDGNYWFEVCIPSIHSEDGSAERCAFSVEFDRVIEAKEPQ